MVHVDLDLGQVKSDEVEPASWGDAVDLKYGDECYGDGDGLHIDNDVSLGNAPQDLATETTCKNAAEGDAVDSSLLPAQISEGMSLCAVTTDGNIAWLTVTSVEGRATREVYPALRIKVVLWD